MKFLDTKTINISLYFITVLFALYSAFQLGKDNMTVTMLIAVVILGIGGYFILKKREKDGFIYVKDVYALMWAALYLILPINQKPVTENIKTTFSHLGNSIKSGNSLILYYTGALVLFIIVQKWKQSLAYRVGLYTIVSLLAVQLFKAAVLVDMGFFIYYLAVFALLCEQIGKNRAQYKSLFKWYLLLLAGLFTLVMLYPNDGAILNRIGNLFYLEGIWPRMTVLILLSGIVCILENYRDLQDVPDGKWSESMVTGFALLCMAIYIFVGKVWPQFFSHLIIYVAAPVSVLIMQYADRQKFSGNLKFSVCRGILICLPAAGRTMNERKWYFLVIYALIIIRFILVKMSSKNGKAKIILQDFWGIAALVLLFCSRHEIIKMSVIRTLNFSLALLLGSCVLWVILTHNTYMFDKQLREGIYTKTDYELIPRQQKICIGLILVMTLLCLLFF